MGSVKWDFANPEMVMIGTETGDPSEMEDLIELVSSTYEKQSKIRYRNLGRM